MPTSPRPFPPPRKGLDEPAGEPLVEGKDWYREGAAVVFTAEFLARRGWCCGNGCRHCPYGDTPPAEGSGESP
jgi:hypothetical protein